MDLLKSTEPGDVFGGVKGVYFLADHGKLTQLCISTLSCMLIIFLAEFRTAIIAAKPMEHLVAGLGGDSDSVRTACRHALIDMAKHSL